MDHLKRVAEEFARQAHTFDKYAEKTDDQVAPRFRAALGASAGGHLLDVACGPGVVTAALAPGAASVVAFDATEEMLEKARSRCNKAGLANVMFKRGDAENLPFPDAQFDGVVTRLAVHHFADPQRAIGEMFRVLRRGGTAVVVDIVSSPDPAESNLQNAIERLRDPSHVRMLPAAELDACMTKAGFEGIEQADVGQGPRVRGMDGDRERPHASRALCAPSFARWPKPVAPPEWGSRSGTAGSCSFTAGVCSAQESRSDIECVVPLDGAARGPQIRCSSPRLRP